jgi:DNA-binding NtrC family response regulator
MLKKYNMIKILVVDDEQSIRRTLKEILEFEKYEFHEACDGVEAIVKIKQDRFDLILMDIKMPKLDGIDALERIQILAPDTPIIMISGHASADNAVDAVKKGAFDFISKPPDLNRLLITVRNALDRNSLIVEKKTLQRKINRSETKEIVGQSDSIRDIMETVERVAPTEARVLITGPNGSGKELIAKYLHEKSNRNDHPLIEVNCAAIPSELIESELFGHEKGSFTSAIKQKLGKFELAHKGILFLDEIGDMSLSAQAKVLRALQENRISRVGGDREISVDVRVIAATNKDLKREIAMGRFREDLYHRLAVIIVKVPGLDQRKSDIPLLVDHFVESICNEYGIPKKKIDADALIALQKLEWTGNIRELRNVVERLIILCNESITAGDIAKHVPQSKSEEKVLMDYISQFDSEEEFIEYSRSLFKKRQEIFA